jgi:negative regulator of sigma E activity
MESSVTRSIEEQLSAFIDGELPDEELQLLVRRLERDEDHRATLARYSLIGNVMRNDGVAAASTQFRAGVMAAIADEQVEQEAPAAVTSLSAGWRKPMAVAAVAVLVVVGFRSTGVLEQSGEIDAATTMLVAGQGDGSEPDNVVVSAAPVPQQQRPVRRRNVISGERLTSYLVSHGDYARSFQGPMANSRIVVQQASFEQ